MFGALLLNTSHLANASVDGLSNNPFVAFFQGILLLIWLFFPALACVAIVLFVIWVRKDSKNSVRRRLSASEEEELHLWADNSSNDGNRPK